MGVACFAAVALTLCTSCAARSEGVDASVDGVAESVESPLPIVFTVGNTLYRSAPGHGSAVVAATESEQIGESGLWAGTRAFYYISPGPSAVALHLLTPGEGGETVVAPGAIHVVATAEDGSCVCLEEDVEVPMAACFYESESSEPLIVAQGIGEVVCDPEMNRYCYSGLVDPQNPTSSIGVMVKKSRDADPHTVQVLEPQQGSTIVAVSAQRALFVVQADATALAGDLFEYDFASEDVHMIAENVWCLASNALVDEAIWVSFPDESDPRTMQPVRATREAGGEWSSLSLGEPVACEGLYGGFSADGTFVSIGEATLGEADRIRVYDAGGTVVGDVELETGVALRECRLAPDGSALVLIVQEASDTNPTSVGPESLRVVDVESGDSTVLVTSRLDRDGGSIAIAGLPDDIADWE